MSKAGKEILLKNVVQVLLHYAMLVFKISMLVCKAIERRIANLWWKNSATKARLHWKRWEIMKTRRTRELWISGI